MSDRLDPVKYEIFIHRLRSILEEGRLAVSMVSGSPAITEGGECMTSFYGSHGEAILTASGTLFHVTGSSDAIRSTIMWYSENPGINEGDQFFYGDPYICGTHIMDQIMIKPIFYKGQCVAWVGTMTHTGDTGGVLRGISTEIYHEGVRIQGMKIVEGDRIRSDLFRCITEQCRDPDYVGLDIMARIASNNVCAQGYLRLIEKFGLYFVEQANLKLQQDTTSSIREKLKNLPDGVWRERVYWSTTKKEGNQEKIHPFKVIVTMTKNGEHLKFSTTGTSLQNEDYRNATYVAARSSLFTAIAGFLFWDIPWNASMIDMVDFEAEEGTILNCRYPASCGLGTQIGSMLTSAALGCISRMLFAAGLIENVNAGWGFSHPKGPGYWYGGRNQFGGIVGSGTYDLFARGNGAAPYRDGVDTGGFYQNAKPCISDVEWIESYFPFLFLARRHALDSGGFGKYRGGMGMEALMLIYGTKELSCDYAPGPRGGEVRNWGLFGGYPVGNVEEGNMLIITDRIMDRIAEGTYPVAYDELVFWGKDIEELQDHLYNRELGGVRIDLEESNILAYQYAAGGGYGDPLDRNIENLKRDIRDGNISLDTAYNIYGVVLEPLTLNIDVEKTETRRKEIRLERLRKAERLSNDAGICKIEKSAKKIMYVHEYIEIVENKQGKKVYSCRKCGTVFCGVEDNYKKYTLRWTKDVREVKKAKQKEESITFYQEYICPGCGTILQVDTYCPIIDDEEPLWDICIK